MKSLAEERDGGFAISPQSLFSGLAICYAGSDGATKAELAKVFRYPDAQIPKLSLKTRLDAKSSLARLGVKDAFDKNSADFDGMIISKSEAWRIYLSGICQEARCDADEDGAEALAATSTVGYSISCAEPESAEFHADRPFVFLLVHNASASVVFAGCVVDPR